MPVKRRMPLHKRCLSVSITIEPDLFKWLEKDRKGVSRSAYLAQMLRNKRVKGGQRGRLQKKLGITKTTGKDISVSDDGSNTADDIKHLG
jgi:hypothetical protein